MDLLTALTSQLGVSEAQARGGAGLLFKLAKEQLDSGDYAVVSSAVPDVEDMVSEAPEQGGLSGALGGLASSLGGSAGGKLAGLASLAGGFKDLNLDASMIGKFIPIVLSVVQARGGDSAKAILEKVLK